MTQETEPKPAPRETLRVQNFVGMTDVTLELSRMNVLIGPSASGKSVCAKLLYFFRQSVWRLRRHIRRNSPSERWLYTEGAQFMRYFPPTNWGEDEFRITFIWGDFQAHVTGVKGYTPAVTVTYSTSVDVLKNKFQEEKRLTDEYRRKNELEEHEAEVESMVSKAFSSAVGSGLYAINDFIPEGRQFHATLHTNSSRLAEADITIDPFIQIFSATYERALDWYTLSTVVGQPDQNLQSAVFSRLATQILRGRLGENQTGHFISHEDGRQVLLSNTSSGQQEVLPLIVMLWNQLSVGGLMQNMFVEEPESHLYPTAQRDVVHLMATVTDLFGSNEGSQYVLTTHSPYILSSLNNLMYGGKIVKETPEKKDKVLAILPGAVLVDPANVRAYMMKDGEAYSIVSSDSGLIVASEIDGVSNELGAEFDELLNIAYEEQAA